MTTKEKRSEIINIYEDKIDEEIKPGIFLKKIGRRFVTVMSIWDETTFDRYTIEEFYNHYV